MIEKSKINVLFGKQNKLYQIFYGCLMENFGIKVYMQEIAGFFKSYTQNTMYISCLTNVFSFQSCKTQLWF